MTLKSLGISASAIHAERLRMDTISSNIANINTTKGRKVNGKWIPYQRRRVVLEEKKSFSRMLDNELGCSAEGVSVKRISVDRSPFKKIYDPTHPEANDEGYVLQPNVDLLTEMTGLTAAQRAYEANLTSFNVAKNMYQKALQLGQ